MSHQVFLHPGDLWTGRCRVGRLTTILGSCVSLVALLPSESWLGVTHAVLPSRKPQRRNSLSGRFVDESVDLFCRELARRGACLQHCELQLFGGGDMFGSVSGEAATWPQAVRIGEQNLRKVMDLLMEHQASLLRQDIGGHWYRHLTVDLATGQCRLDKNLLQQAAYSQVLSDKAGRYD